MGTLEINELVDLSLNLIFYFTIGSFGAFFKVLYESMTRKNYKIRIGKIIIGGGTTAIICAGLNYNILYQYNIGVRFMVAALVGVLGFEIFGKIRTIAGLKNFINELAAIMNGVKEVQQGRNIDNSEENKSGESNNEEKDATRRSTDLEKK